MMDDGFIARNEALTSNESDLGAMMDAAAGAAEEAAARRRERQRDRESQEQHWRGMAHWHRHLQGTYAARAAEHARLAERFGG